MGKVPLLIVGTDIVAVELVLSHLGLLLHASSCSLFLDFLPVLVFFFQPRSKKAKLLERKKIRIKIKQITQRLTLL